MTITTVGYGDYFPVTPTGQLVAVGVMIGGIALIGVVTATLASWIVEKVGESNKKEEAATKVEMEMLTSEIRALREEAHPRLAGPQPGEIHSNRAPATERLLVGSLRGRGKRRTGRSGVVVIQGYDNELP